MTCEVAIMNKYAVVLAADSAVTTRDGKGADRYSKGGNKIFQLSRHEPVGVMIYGAATLNGVPWEIIIKSFRATLGDGKFPTLREYAVSFFNFVKSAKQLFPNDDLAISYRRCLNAAAIRLLNEGREANAAIGDASLSADVRKAAWADYLSDRQAELDAADTHPEIANGAYPNALADIHTHIPSDVDGYLQGEGLQDIVDIDAWFSCACRYFYVCNTLFLTATGIVFSGYGTEQYFPEVIEYEVPGFVNEDFVYTKQDFHSCQVSHEKPSAIFQFAMTSSIDAFTQGMDVEAFVQGKNCYSKEAKALAVSLLEAANVAVPADIDAQVAASTEAFLNTWVSYVADLHYHPMKRVIATLPIEEMTHLAETLVILQSLKERVTSPSQSVGGPIDVAVITKAEGLVWIKRKHFFEAEKNLGYVLRQKALSI